MRHNQPQITVVLPWTSKATARQAQKLAKAGKCVLHGSSKGLEITASPDIHLGLGLAKASRATAPISRVRQAGVETVAGRVVTYPGGGRLVEISLKTDAKVAGVLAKQLAQGSEFDLVTLYDQKGRGHTKAANKRYAAYETIPKPRVSAQPSKRRAEVTKSRLMSLVTALQDLWDEAADEMGEALDTQRYETPTVQEFVLDNAAGLLEGEQQELWNGLDSEEQTRLLEVAFPSDAALTVRRERWHFQNTTKGASRKSNTSEEPYDPTDFTASDMKLDRFSRPFRMDLVTSR